MPRRRTVGNAVPSINDEWLGTKMEMISLREGPDGESLLKIDRRYQRPLSKKRVEKMAADFKERAVGALTVSKRSDGFYYVQDGQHRLSLLRMMNIPYARCIVSPMLPGESDEDAAKREAQDFVHDNATSKVGPVQKFKANYFGDSEVEKLIVEIAEKYGFIVSGTNGRGRPPKGITVITAVAALYEVWNEGQEDLLDKTLKVLSSGFVYKDRNGDEVQHPLGVYDLIIYAVKDVLKKHPHWTATTIANAIKGKAKELLDHPPYQQTPGRRSKIPVIIKWIESQMPRRWAA